jgi:hypothetical protein
MFATSVAALLLGAAVIAAPAAPAATTAAIHRFINYSTGLCLDANATGAAYVTSCTSPNNYQH